MISTVKSLTVKRDFEQFYIEYDSKLQKTIGAVINTNVTVRKYRTYLYLSHKQTSFKKNILSKLKLRVHDVHKDY